MKTPHKAVAVFRMRRSITSLGNWEDAPSGRCRAISQNTYPDRQPRKAATFGSADLRSHGCHLSPGGEVFPCLFTVCELSADGFFVCTIKQPVPLAVAHLLLRRRLLIWKNPLYGLPLRGFYIFSRISWAYLSRSSGTPCFSRPHLGQESTVISFRSFFRKRCWKPHSTMLSQIFRGVGGGPT